MLERARGIKRRVTDRISTVFEVGFAQSAFLAEIFLRRRGISSTNWWKCESTVLSIPPLGVTVEESSILSVPFPSKYCIFLSCVCVRMMCVCGWCGGISSLCALISRLIMIIIDSVAHTHNTEQAVCLWAQSQLSHLSPD